MQIFGVKAFREPAVNLRQLLPGFLLLALLLPQPREAHHRAEFERLGLLFLGDGDGRMKTVLWGRDGEAVPGRRPFARERTGRDRPRCSADQSRCG